MIKRFIIAIILLSLFTGGIVGFNMFRAQAISDFFANMPRPAVSVATVKAAPVTWKPGIEAVGTVVARRGVDIASQASGVVESIVFFANQKVLAGSTLVTIDSKVEQADLIAAQAAVIRDQQSLDRARQLATRGVNSTATLETAQAQLDTSRSTLERLKAVLEQKTIEAPFDGTIGIPRIDVGQYVTPGTVIATLQDLETMKVDFTVPEQLLPQLAVGQPARFGLTREDMGYLGKITGIEPKIDAASRLVSVQAEVANPEGRLRPGQFINVRVELPDQAGVLALPQTAVVTSLYGSYVYIVEPPAAAAEGAEPPPPTVRQVFVETGRRNATEIEVISGVKAGEEVVTAGQNRLSPGSPVTIRNTPATSLNTSPEAPNS